MAREECIAAGDRVMTGRPAISFGTVRAVFYRPGTPDLVAVAWDEERPSLVRADRLIGVEAALHRVRLADQSGTKRVLDDRIEPGDVC